MRYIKVFAPALLAALALCGCTLTDEELAEPDITLDKLENSMAEATDPHGRYREAKTFVLKQVVETKRAFGKPLVQMVETKIMRPGYFKLTTYDDNQPQMAVISNGESSWIVDYKEKKVRKLDADGLRRMKQFTDISSPGGRLSAAFKGAVLRSCRIGDARYYRIECPTDKNTTLNAYVGADSRQIERITLVTDGEVTYDSSLRGYALYEGVRIPEETLVRAGGVEKVSKVIYCKLNAPLEISEFRPPVF